MALGGDCVLGACCLNGHQGKLRSMTDRTEWMGSLWRNCVLATKGKGETVNSAAQLCHWQHSSGKVLCFAAEPFA